VVLLEAELERDHRHVFERVAQRLRFVPLRVAEEIPDDVFRQPEHPREPGEHVVEYRPDEHGEKDPENTFFVECPQRLPHGQQQ